MSAEAGDEQGGIVDRRQLILRGAAVVAGGAAAELIGSNEAVAGHGPTPEQVRDGMEFKHRFAQEFIQYRDTRRSPDEINRNHAELGKATLESPTSYGVVWRKSDHAKKWAGLKCLERDRVDNVRVNFFTHTDKRPFAKYAFMRGSTECFHIAFPIVPITRPGIKDQPTPESVPAQKRKSLKDLTS